VGEVVGLDERDGEATRRRVQGHPRPGDPATDHQDVHRGLSQLRDLPFTPVGVE
jgi:hypothetical protein